MWNGFEEREIIFEGRKASLVIPDKICKKKQWLFKMEYRDAFPGVEIEMLKRGWHVAFIENKNRWCEEEDLDLKKRFADFLIENYKLESKYVLVGMSCGGMFAVRFAAKYPPNIAALYLDAPVLNLLSCPADMGIGQSGMWEEFHEATGMTKSELICYRKHPMDCLEVLGAYQIPIVMVYGKEDIIVPYCENGEVLEKYYKTNQVKMLEIGKDGCGHHPHGVENPAEIADFIESISN